LPDAGEKVGVAAAIVYTPTVVPLCEIPPPAAIALRVVVVEIVIGQGLEHDGDD
jgi:hypothetical protein